MRILPLLLFAAVASPVLAQPMDHPVHGDHVGVGMGGLVSAYALPDGLKTLYDSPTSGLAFLRLRLR